MRIPAHFGSVGIFGNDVETMGKKRVMEDLHPFASYHVVEIRFVGIDVGGEVTSVLLGYLNRVTAKVVEFYLRFDAVDLHDTRVKSTGISRVALANDWRFRVCQRAQSKGR